MWLGYNLDDSCVCLSSGLGWLPFWWHLPGTNKPVDTWQPEAITFLSLYLSPLFCFSMALQIGILTLLLLGERTRQIRYAVTAGILGFILGLVHSYDIITIAAIWLSYLLWQSGVQAFRRSGVPFTSWLHAAVAGVIAAPAVYYIYIH